MVVEANPLQEKVREVEAMVLHLSEQVGSPHQKNRRLKDLEAVHLSRQTQKEVLEW